MSARMIRISKSRTAPALAAILVIALLSVGVAAAQTTIHVPADVATIQAAINAAANGDTVLVAPGTYFENLNFNGKAITVTSSAGPSVTIIDGGAKTSVVTFNSGETAASVLNGFTIQNGSTYYYAGGIQITNSSPTITANVITNNHATEGLGINVYGGSPLIRGNTITGNSQIGSGGGGGGGIQTGGTSSNPSSPTIIGNTITNNSLQGGGNGGGIHADYYGTPIIQNNLIQGNYAYNYGGGISVWSYNGAIVSQNIIVNNAAGGGGNGGGLAIYASSGVSAVNNTIAGNTAYNGASGVYIASGAPQSNTIANNIVVASAGQSAVLCDSTWSGSSPIFTNNDFYSASGPASSGVCDLSSAANISLDPLFVNPAGDFHLQAGSPAIDAGSNTAVNLPKTDYDGNPRILDGKNTCVSTIDMGAYEVLPGAVNLSFSPASLTFAGQVIGTSSSALLATFANAGSGCFHLSSAQISSEFSQANNCPAALPSGQSCTYNVSFTPSASGPQSGALTISGSNGFAASNASLALSGTGIMPAAVSLSATQLAFAPQPIGTTSGAQTVTLSNIGGAALSISGISTAAPFAETNNCPSSLASGAACLITVTFSSQSTGTQSGSLIISDNAAGSPQLVALTGTATDFSLAISPSTATVKHGGSVQFAVSVGVVGGPFNASVALSCSGLPSGARCGFAPSAQLVGSGYNSTMTLSTAASTPRGTFAVHVNGTSGALQHSLPITLIVK